MDGGSAQVIEKAQSGQGNGDYNLDKATKWRYERAHWRRPMADRDIPTVTVVGSNAVARADGRAAIVLETKERGPIAFEVSLQSIAVLRPGLAAAETILLRQTGTPQGH